MKIYFKNPTRFLSAILLLVISAQAAVSELGLSKPDKGERRYLAVGEFNELIQWDLYCTDNAFTIARRQKPENASEFGPSEGLSFDPASINDVRAAIDKAIHWAAASREANAESFEKALAEADRRKWKFCWSQKVGASVDVGKRTLYEVDLTALKALLSETEIIQAEAAEKKKARDKFIDSLK